MVYACMCVYMCVLQSYPIPWAEKRLPAGALPLPRPPDTAPQHDKSQLHPVKP